jgi:hypothetical protein
MSRKRRPIAVQRPRQRRQPARVPWWKRPLVWVGGLATAIAAGTAGAFGTGFGQDLFSETVGQHTTAASIASPFNILTTWPTVHGCDSATEVAVFPGGPSPVALKISPYADLRVVLTRDGAAAFGTGYLYLTFTVVGNSVAQIVNIRPLFYLVDSRRPGWVYNPQGGCGGTYGRVFALNLDKRTLVDEGIQGSSVFHQPRDPKPIADPLGSSFHVSQNDPAQILIEATACKAYYEWGLQITYVIGNREFVKIVGTQNDPFRSVGNLTRGVPMYSLAAGASVKGAGTVRQPYGCQVLS